MYWTGIGVGGLLRLAALLLAIGLVLWRHGEADSGHLPVANVANVAGVLLVLFALSLVLLALVLAALDLARWLL
jgi:hypothetical protein